MKLDLNYKGIEFQVEFDYQPEEPTVYYLPDGSGDPGCPAEVTLNKITHFDEDFYEILEGQVGNIEETIFKQLNDEREE